MRDVDWTPPKRALAGCIGGECTSDASELLLSPSTRYRARALHRTPPDGGQRLANRQLFLVVADGARRDAFPRGAVGQIVRVDVRLQRRASGVLEATQRRG